MLQLYLRLQAQDAGGVLAVRGDGIGDEDVSLDMILQKRSDAGTAEIVLVTHDVREADFRALDHISRMSPPIGTINSVFGFSRKRTVIDHAGMAGFYFSLHGYFHAVLPISSIRNRQE